MNQFHAMGNEPSSLDVSLSLVSFFLVPLPELLVNLVASSEAVSMQNYN